MITDTDHQQRILAARSRLMDVLARMTRDVGDRAAGRCPYRARFDVCTFAAGCRNQLRDAHAAPRCGGGTLNPRRAR